MEYSSPNNKYASPMEVMEMVSRRLKNKTFGLKTIADLSLECERFHLKSEYYTLDYVQMPFIVDNGRVTLPSFIERITKLSARIDGEPMRINDNGSYLFLPSDFVPEKDKDGNPVVYLDFKAFPIDEQTGYPLILRGHEYACARYCEEALLYEDYLTGKLDTNRWMIIQNATKDAIAKASVLHKYLDDYQKKKMFNVMYNMIQNPAKYNQR